MPASALGTYGVDLALELLEQIRLTCDPDSPSAAIPTLHVVK
jgi:hypothetical protein